MSKDLEKIINESNKLEKIAMDICKMEFNHPLEYASKWVHKLASFLSDADLIVHEAFYKQIEAIDLRLKTPPPFLSLWAGVKEDKIKEHITRDMEIIKEAVDICKKEMLPEIGFYMIIIKIIANWLAGAIENEIFNSKED